MLFSTRETADDHTSSGYNHFKSFLGYLTIVENKNEEIKPVFQKLPEKMEHSPSRSIKLLQARVEDGILPEVLKLVVIYDLVPHKVLMDHGHPRQ